MTDILNRLRAAATPLEQFAVGVLPTRALYGEAADEIEKLRSTSIWVTEAMVDAALVHQHGIAWDRSLTKAHAMRNSMYDLLSAALSVALVMEPVNIVKELLATLEPFAKAGSDSLISGNPPGNHVDASAFIRAIEVFGNTQSPAAPNVRCVEAEAY